MAALIEVRNLVNRFGRQTVHDGLNMDLRHNEILGLVGGSGSGKSVLLRSILGLNTPQEGEILVEGTNLQSLPPGKRLDIERKWGVVFQNGALFSGLSVLDNIALPMREHTDLSAKAIEELARFKLGMVGLEAATADKMPAQLSGGMARRVALARALALDPKILFLDEPTSGLDPIAAAAFDELSSSLRVVLELSVLVITHDLDTLVTICDRIAMIIDKKIETGTLQDMLESQHPWVHDYFHGPRMRAVLNKETQTESA